MIDRQFSSSKHLTFSERYGYEKLPSSMQLEQISDDLRREIWNATREYLINHRRSSTVHYFDPSFRKFIERLLGKILKKPEDEISTLYADVLNLTKSIILKGKFDRVLSLLEIIHNDNFFSDTDFLKKISYLFDSHAAAYWLEVSRKPYEFLPRSSMEQGTAVHMALNTVEASNMTGASVHLRKAAELVNTQQYADSISNSILAVESIARIIDPKAEKTLTPALKSLENAGLIKHPALKNAFSKLYGYINDEQGIRHALIDQNSPEVGLHEALFMFGACASFAAYLVNQHQQLEQILDGA